MNNAYLLLGSNLNDPFKQLNKACGLIETRLGKITRMSRRYQTAPWGMKDQADFINQAIRIETSMDAQALMTGILDIEHLMGRTRKEKNEARIIDIDILFFNKLVSDSESLTVPHKLLHKRRFVLVPLNEISPLLKHPVLNKNIHTLLKECEDKLAVNKIP